MGDKISQMRTSMIISQQIISKLMSYTVLAEDAIKAALKDFKTKQEAQN